MMDRLDRIVKNTAEINAMNRMRKSQDFVFRRVMKDLEAAGNVAVRDTEKAREQFQISGNINRIKVWSPNGLQRLSRIIRRLMHKIISCKITQEMIDVAHLVPVDPLFRDNSHSFFKKVASFNNKEAIELLSDCKYLIHEHNKVK